MNTTTAIRILPARPDLAHLTHSAGAMAARDLARRIEQAEALGLTVLAATSYRRTVPTSYGPTHKIDAPAWRFNAETRAIRLVSCPPASRPFGRSIPVALTVEGEVPTPRGWKCVKRANGKTEFRVS
jgi:hypothetical protein